MKLLNSEQIGAVEEAVTLLKNSGVIAFPTETVFGLGADAFDEKAVKKIYEIKGRNYTKPLSLHVGTMEMAYPYIKSVPSETERLISRFLPGPLMLIFEKTELVPDFVTGGLRKIGIRVPRNDTFSALSAAYGKPLAATSANLSGNLSPVNEEYVTDCLDGKADAFIRRGDEVLLGIESTVLDVSAKPFRLIRRGFVSPDDIKYITGVDIVLSDDGKAPQLRGNYSKIQIILVEGERMKVLRRIKRLAEKYTSEYPAGVGILVADGSDEYLGSLPHLKIMGSTSEPDVIARNFFACLRTFEKEEIELVLVEGIKRDGLGWAIMDRISGYAKEIIDEGI